MNKKAQTSIEFIVLLACVSTLSLSGILLYKNLAAKGADTASRIGNETFAVQNKTYVPINTPKPYLSIYFPANSTVNLPNKMQIDAYGCYNGQANFSIHSNSISFSRTELSLNITGIAIANISFAPTTVGPNTGSTKYSINCGSENTSGSYSLWTYAAYPQQPSGGQGDYAFISERNESIIYPLLNLGSVENFTTFNHCTYVNFWTVPYGISTQCGYAYASDYRVFDGSCLAPGYPYTRTYCIVPEALDYSVNELNGSSYSLKYTLKLTIQTYVGIATANISSSSPNATVYLDGQKAGAAIVSNPYAPSYLPQQIIVQNQNQSYSYGNSTIYSQYRQATNNLDNLLQYYNNTGVSGDEQSSIEAATYAVSTSSSSLVSSLKRISDTACVIENNSYDCRSQVPFTYEIKIALPGLTEKNLSLYYDGTLILVN